MSISTRNLKPTHEYRSPADDAWYDVQVVFNGNTLTVKYSTLPDYFDERFEAGNFESLEKVEEFAGRFRPVSVQYQDGECNSIVQGIPVSSSCEVGEDRRFYDAFVENVERMDHSFEEGEEVCLCRFKLSWKHGPHEGNVTDAGIESICQILPNMQIDPKLANFLDKSRKKVKSLLPNSSDATIQKKTSYTNVKHKSRPLGAKRGRKSGESKLKMVKIEDRELQNCERIDHSTDLGGEMFKNPNLRQIILVENLEKDLSPLAIVEFIRSQTKITTQAYVSPSLPSETYTRGTIVLDCKEMADKLYAFLDSPDRIIISSRGRPWVIIEKYPIPKTFEMSIENFMPCSQNNSYENNGICEELRVVDSRSTEYKTAKQLRDLLVEFIDHQKGLHKRLVWEEKNILRLAL